MTRRRSVWRRASLGAVLIAVVVVVVIVARHGHGAPALSQPLWTTRPVVAAPVTTVQEPWIELARRLKPAVVNVNTTRTEQPPHTVRSLGSGFIINADGYVVTNNHVVDGASEIRAKLADGRELPARVVGRDAKTDVALLKIPASGLPVIPLADASELQVGEPVMAIGNPFGLEQTVTTGIVSATGRVIGAGAFDDFIQTDASINPGNSGGPLINLLGQAVGINTAIFTADGGSNGIGFAIPITVAKTVITQLAATGHIVHGWLGVSIQPVSTELAKILKAPGTTGALVALVAKDSPAMKAGVQAGDIIVEYAGRPVALAASLPRVVAETPVGRAVGVTVLRNGTRVALTATIEEQSEPARPMSTRAHAEKTALGVTVESLTPQLVQQLGLSDREGALVRAVQDGSRAAEAGLRPGDVIVEVDRHHVKSVAAVRRAVTTHASGIPLLLLVHRGGDSMFVTLD